MRKKSEKEFFYYEAIVDGVVIFRSKIERQALLMLNAKISEHLQMNGSPRSMSIVERQRQLGEDVELGYI